MCYLSTFKRSRGAVSIPIVGTNHSKPGNQAVQHQGLQRRHIRQKKKVTMKPAVTVYPIEQRARNMTASEKSPLYYSPEELEHFNLEAKAVGKKIIGSSSTQTCTYPTAQQCLESDDSLRGLEMNVCQERVRNKFFANRALLSYQDHASSSEMSRDRRDACLAAVSSKMSQWSKSIALETARLDTLRAYEGENADVPVVTQQPICILPFPTLKRRVTEEDEDMAPSCKRIRLNENN